MEITSAKGIIKPFNLFTYKTRDGETITATTNNGVVTIVGDKNGVRQMPLKDFHNYLLNTATVIGKPQNADVVAFSGKNEATSKTYKNPGIGATIGGVTAGSVVSGLVTVPATITSLVLMDKMKQLSKGLSQDDFVKLENAVADTLNKTGLNNKSVKIINVTKENIDEVAKICNTEIEKGFTKYLPKWYKNKIANNTVSMVNSGENAFYMPKSNIIVASKKEMGLSLFHEMGHAANANLSKFGKILQKCKGLAILTVPISLIAFFKTKKAEGEQPQGMIDKTTNFVKENAGKLTFAAFIPMLLEEGLATIKGNKFAKDLLSPELAKKVAKTNRFGFITYLVTATLTALGVYAGVKVKDAIAHRTVETEKK